jgi:hypothetical protein
MLETACPTAITEATLIFIRFAHDCRLVGTFFVLFVLFLLILVVVRISRR